MTPCGLAVVTSVSKNHIASIFGVKRMRMWKKVLKRERAVNENVEKRKKARRYRSYIFILKMEAIHYSETSVKTYKTK
jgi:hypothetical protein